MDRQCLADSAGNVYFAGQISGNVDLNPDPVDTDWHDAGSSYNAFLSKFNADGDFQWAHDWGLSGQNDRADGVAAGSGGSFVYVAGSFGGTDVDFDPDPVGEDLHSSNGDGDAFFAKLDSSGDFQWCKTWGGSLSDGVYGGVAESTLGDVFVAGSYRGTCDFDPDPIGTDEHTSYGERDVFVSRFDSSGNFVWVATWGSDSYEGCGIPATNSIGESWVTGCFTNAADFNPDPVGVEEHTSAGEEDIYLVKLLPNGLW